MDGINVIGQVESARRAKAPIVAVSVPGELPFCIRRELLTKTLLGLTVVDAGIQQSLDGKRCGSMLVIYATGKGVQAVRRFVPLPNRSQVQLELYKWAERLRERKSKGVGPKRTARDKQIERLRKQLSRLGKLSTPVHPLLADVRERKDYYREADERNLLAWERMVVEGTQCERPLTHGETWREWKREAGARRWIQQQARECKAGRVTTAQLYKTLGERGIVTRKWSDLRTHDRERCEGKLFGYLAILWEFCDCMPKPYGFEPMTEQTLGSKLYEHWLEGLHTRKQLREMIEAVEAI